MMVCTIQGFVTDQEKALEQLFGEHSDGTRDFEVALDTIAARLATVFASLQVLLGETEATRSFDVWTAR